MSSDKTLPAPDGRPWNKGQLIGQKRPLSLRTYGSSASDWNFMAADEMWRSSTWQLIASFEPVIWFVLRFRTFTLDHAPAKEPLSSRRRPAAQRY